MRMNWEERPSAIATLVRMYPDHSSTEIAEAIGCSKYSVQKKGIKMGLKKSQEFSEKYCQNLATGPIEEKTNERSVKRLPFEFFPVYSTASLLMLPCRGWGMANPSGQDY